MAIVEKVIAAPQPQVFDVLKDGWSYSDWVVGTTHIRDVDDHWPTPGARLHHTVGPWPLSLRDTSVVLSCSEPHHLTLRAGLRPLGEAMIVFTLIPVHPQATRVTIAESFVAGALHWAWGRISDFALQRRNEEMLHRLADVATRQRVMG